MLDSEASDIRESRLLSQIHLFFQDSMKAPLSVSESSDQGATSLCSLRIASACPSSGVASNCALTSSSRGWVAGLSHRGSPVGSVCTSGESSSDIAVSPASRMARSTRMWAGQTYTGKPFLFRVRLVRWRPCNPTVVPIVK